MKDTQLNPEIRWIMQMQGLTLCFLLVVSSVFKEPIFVFSLFVGGLIALIPSYLMAWWFFSYRGASSAGKMLKALYSVEAIKWLLAVIGFSVLFGLFEGSLLAALLGFLAVQSIVWLVPFRGLGKR